MKDKQLLLAIMAQLEREKIVSIPQLALLLGVDEQRIYDALETLVFAYDAASIRLDLHDSYATLQTYGTLPCSSWRPALANSLLVWSASSAPIASRQSVRRRSDHAATYAASFCRA